MFSGSPGQDARNHYYRTCPICGSTKRYSCRLRGDSIIFCWGSGGHVPSGYKLLGQDKYGAFMFVEDDGRGDHSPPVYPKPRSSKKQKPFDTNAKSKEIREAGAALPAANERLAERLGVPLSGITDADVHFTTAAIEGETASQFWVPRFNVTKDGETEFANCHVRVVLWDKSTSEDLKLNYGGGQPLCIIGRDLPGFNLARKPSTPILSPEGYSGLVPLYAAGFDCAGRNNNATSGLNLARLFMSQASRGIILIADNDKGAGLFGACSVARQMTEAGFPEHAIRVSIPRGQKANGEKVKDSRDSWNAFAPGCWDDRVPEVQARLAAWGERYLAELQADAMTVEQARAMLQDKVFDVQAKGLWGDFKIEPEAGTPREETAQPGRKHCRKQGQVMMPHSDGFGIPVVIYPPCRKLDCTTCRPVLMKECRDTINFYLGKLPKRSKVFVAVVPGDAAWDRAVKAMKDHRKRTGKSVEFIRIGPNQETGKSFAVMTWLPGRLEEAAEAVSPAKAIEWMAAQCDAFEASPWLSFDHFFSTSRAWPRLYAERPPSSGRLTRLGRLKKGAKPEAIYEEHGLKPQKRTTGDALIVQAQTEIGTGKPVTDRTDYSDLRDSLVSDLVEPKRGKREGKDNDGS